MASSSQIMRRVEPMSAGLRGKRASKAGQHEWRGAGAKPRAMRVDNTLVVGLGTAGGAAVSVIRLIGHGHHDALDHTVASSDI